METIGERIAWIIAQNGLKKVDFARKVGISGGYVTYLIQGKNPPSEALVKLIASEFHVREAWLLTGEGSPEEPRAADALDAVLDHYGLPTFLRGLFLRYARLSPAAQAEVEKQIQEWALELAAEQPAPRVPDELPRVPDESRQKPWDEMTKEEKIAEFTRQLDEEEATQGEEHQHGGGASA